MTACVHTLCPLIGLPKIHEQWIFRFLCGYPTVSTAHRPALRAPIMRES
jgi:hypothetical protein